MGWPYEFADLTDTQKQHRRVLLDAYGLVAQASAGIVLILIQLYFLLQWLNHQRNASDGLHVPSSPSLKSSQKGGPFNTRVLAQSWRRLKWWLGDSVTILGVDLGTNGQLTAAVAWTVWLLLLSFAETGNDYLHLTKRFGIVGASQLPFHYLLVWKSSWSPIQTLTRTSHETLNAYHQALGRIITLLVFLHAAFYLNFYVQANILGNKLKEAYVLCGVVGSVAFAAIGTTALSPVRRWSYRVFYIVHVVLATALLPVLFFHVHHIRIYLYETLVIYALNALTRWLSVSTRRGTVRSIPNTSLVEVSIPCDARGSSPRLLTDYRPGQHAYVSLTRSSLSRTFQSNPLTAVSVPSTDKHLKFVARALDGNTKKLAKIAGKDSGVEANLAIEGPYGLNTLDDKLLQYDRVLFVAGGVGATFVLPLYRQLLADLSPGKGSYRRQKVTFIWIAKSESEVAWAIPTHQREKDGFVERLKVCITGASTSATGVDENGMDYNDGGAEAVFINEDDGIELEEQKQLLADGNEPATTRNDLPISIGRPDLRRLVHQALSHGNSERVAIVTCGPRALSQSLRREIAPWIKRGRDAWFHDESFSL